MTLLFGVNSLETYRSQRFDEQNERHTALKDNAITSAITISDNIITQNESKLSADNLNLVKIVALANAIKALTQYEDGKLPAAIKTYERSL